MALLRLVFRALRWRGSATASLLAVASLAVFAAALGPLYLLTSQETVLHAVLAQASPSQDGITALAQLPAVTSSSAAQAMIPVAHDYHLARWYRPAVVTVDAGIRFRRLNRPQLTPPFFVGDLVSRTAICAHLSLAAGRCPDAIDQVAITQRTATALNAHLGSQLRPEGLGVLTVVGIVRLGNPNLAYWWGMNFFNFAPAIYRPFPLPSSPAQLDGIWTVPATIYGLSGTATAQFALRVGRTKPTALQPLVDGLAGFDYVARQQYGMLVTSGLIAKLNDYGRQVNLMAAVIAVVDLQLLVLAVFLTFSLSARLAQGRRNEVALGQLRGLRQPSVLAIGLLEPLLICLCALPIGLALAWGATGIASSIWLHGDPVEIQPLVIGAALAAFLGSLLAAVLGGVGILSSRALDGGARRDSPLSAWAWAFLDGAVLALAVAGLVQLATTGTLAAHQADPVAIFAPGLLAVALAVVGVRSLPWLGRAALRGARHTRSVSLGLALRQVLRQPASLRQVVVLCVAFTLGCFAINGWMVAQSNRIDRANFELGAAQVLQVRVPNSVMLVDAVRRADPGGRYAMAAMAMRGSSQNLLAVDASRLMRVGYWPAAISHSSRTQIVAWLTSRTPPALVLRGTKVRMTVGLAGAPATHPDLQFNLVDGGNFPQVADFGYLGRGSHTYVATLPSECSGGCRVTDLVPNWSAASGGPQQATYSLSLYAIQVLRHNQWHSVQAPIFRPGYWRSGSAAVTVRGRTGAITLGFHDTAADLSPPAALAAPPPSVVPAVVTSASQPGKSLLAGVSDFDGTLLTVNPKIVVSALPGLGQYGFLLDLPLAIQAETSQPVGTTDYVWLAPGSPTRIVGALQAQGLRILARSNPAQLLAVYDQSGLALAYLFFLFAAAAAVGLAVAATMVSHLVMARRRRSELAGLGVSGLGHSTLVRALMSEQLLLVVPGLVLGLLAGELGTWWALPSLPESATQAGAPPLDLTIPVLPTLGLGLGLLLLLVLAAWISAVSAIRSASTDGLRFAEG